MAKQKTHEEFIKQLAEKFPWLRVLSFYVNSKTKVKVEDTRCGHVWEAFPTDLLGGHGCPCCGFKRTAESRKTPLQVMLQKLKEVWNGLIEYVSGYDGMCSTCIFRCMLDGTLWESTPYSVINKKSGCPCCVNQKLSKLFTIPENEMIFQIEEASNYTIEYVSGYVNMSTKCLFRCKNCEHVWETKPYIIKQGHGCPKCAIKRTAKKNTVPIDKRLKQVYEIHGDKVIYISGFVTNYSKCVWQCKDCGHTWEATMNQIISQKTGCPHCASNAPVSTIEAEARIYKVNEKNFKILNLEVYKNVHSRLKFECLKCGHIIEVCAYNMFVERRCPVCARKSMEQPVLIALDRKGINYKHDKGLDGCYFNNSRVPLRPDFIIETDKGKLAIETDGAQHYLPIYGEDELLERQAKDRYKDKVLKEKGFIIIRVTSSPNKEWGYKNCITLVELLDLIEKGIDSDTKEINFELFRKYDFYRE